MSIESTTSADRNRHLVVLREGVTVAECRKVVAAAESKTVTSIAAFFG
jgi:hypothetical protein